MSIFTPPPPVQSEMLDLRAVAALMNCSPRHIRRLAAAGRMPAPVKLGTLIRWPRRALQDWIAAGCPDFQDFKQKGDIQ